jgi:hypothetical protein
MAWHLTAYRDPAVKVLGAADDRIGIVAVRFAL